MKNINKMKLIYDILPPFEDAEMYSVIEAIENPQRIIDLRQDTKDTEFNINDEDLKNGYIGYASWDSKISIPLRS